MPPAEHPAPATSLRAQLNARYHDPLMSFFLRRIKNHAQAEDFTQDVLLRAIRAADFGRVENAESYIFKIAINLLRDHERKVRRSGARHFVPIDDALAGELEAALVEDVSPERVLLSRDSLADALRALDELDERTRNIFVLFRLENMKQKEIAALYGIGLSTVEKHVMKAVLHLAARYGRK